MHHFKLRQQVAYTLRRQWIAVAGSMMIGPVLQLDVQRFEKLAPSGLPAPWLAS